MSGVIDHFGQHLPKLVRCFREGGGIPYADYRPDFTCHMDATWRRIYDELLISGFLGRVEGLDRRLAGGIACSMSAAAAATRSTSWRGNIRNRALSATTSPRTPSPMAWRKRAEWNCRTRASRCSTWRRLPAAPRFDLITAFDAIHDQLDPATVLRRISDALAEGGAFVMVDFKFSSSVDGNIGNPFAPLYYGISLMHCMTVSLAYGGAGLGAVWGIEKAKAMLAEAGFRQVEVLDSPRPQNCIYVCGK